MEIKKPSIYDHLDVRSWLSEIFDWHHSKDSSFTKAHACKELGSSNSRSYFQDILNGKFISDAKTPLFIRLFRLGVDEARYFRVLVDFSQEKSDPERRQLLFEQLLSLNRSQARLIASNEYVYYKDWHHCVVRALLDITEFREGDDCKAMGRLVSPNLTEGQVKSSLVLLKELGLVAPDAGGFLKPADKVISTGTFARDEFIRQHQLAILDAARRIMITNTESPQRILTKTVSISDVSYKQIAAVLEKCNTEINTIIRNDTSPSDRIYQLSIAMVPHAIATQQQGHRSTP